MTRVLITGVSGQIGSEAAKRFADFARVIAADRGRLDLSRPSDLAARLDELAPDVIVNSAAYTAVDRAEDERDFAFIVNTISPEEMPHWAPSNSRLTLSRPSARFDFGPLPWMIL